MASSPREHFQNRFVRAEPRSLKCAHGAGSATWTRQDDAVAVGIGVAPPGGVKTIDKCVAARGRDEGDLPPIENRLPAIATRYDRLVVLPRLDREELDPRVDRDRQLRDSEFEP